MFLGAAQTGLAAGPAGVPESQNGCGAGQLGHNMFQVTLEPYLEWVRLLEQSVKAGMGIGQ